MKFWITGALAALCCALSAQFPASGDDDDDAGPAKAGQPATPTLNGEQQHAIGIGVARPLPMKVPDRIEGVGLVLDATGLVSDVGEATAATAALHSASAELARTRGLYNGGAGASLRALEAAQAEQVKIEAQVLLATARLSLNWGPLAALPAGPRQKAIEAAASGRTLLLRADLPGRHTVGELPTHALLTVDGVQVPGRILGAMRQSGDLQSVGWLVEVPNAPAGLGPGARVPVDLLLPERRGLLLSRDAVLYDENGAYVYKQLGQPTGGKTRYAAVRVTLLVPFGDGWLVDGVDDDDDIVVHGAGVLWSLQGMGAHAVDDDD